MSLYESIPRWIIETPDHLETQEMCKRVVEEKPYTLEFVPDHLKMKEICERAVGDYPWTSKFVPDHFKTQEMCNEAVRRRPWLLLYVPDWFVTQEQLKLWHDNDDCGDYELIEWYEGYQKCKVQKAKKKKS